MYKLPTMQIPNCFQVEKASSRAEGMKEGFAVIGSRNEIALSLK